MNTLLLRNIRVNGAVSDILIEDGKISGIAGNMAADADTIIDCTGKAAVPAFANMHTHAAMTLMRGVEEDLPLESWLKTIWRVEAGLDEEMIYWGTKLACLEMIKSGTAVFNDQYWMPDAAVEAVKDMGIRSFSSWVTMDFFDPEKSARQFDELQAAYERSLKWGDNSSFVVACHAVYTVSEDLLVKARDFSRKHGLLYHIHLSETETEVAECVARNGVSPVKYLDRLGILGPDVIAAHTLWLDDEDVEILGRNRVTVVHNVNSNLKIASGYKFKYSELKQAGANVTLGTDGCASSNNLDMLEAAKTASMLQKAWRKDPKAMPLEEIADILSVNGYKALGINGGTIAPGADADIAIVNLENQYFIPGINFLSNLYYSAHSDAIDTLVCRGKIVMSGRNIKGEQEIYDNARIQARRLMEKAGIAMEY